MCTLEIPKEMRGSAISKKEDLSSLCLTDAIDFVAKILFIHAYIVFFIFISWESEVP